MEEGNFTESSTRSSITSFLPIPKGREKPNLAKGVKVHLAVNLLR